MQMFSGVHPAEKNDKKEETKKEPKNDDLTNQLRNASDIVYGDIQANPNEPKYIIISSRKDIDDSIINKYA